MFIITDIQVSALSAQPGVSENDNMDGTVTVSPAGTEKEGLPVPAGVRIAQQGEI